MMTNSQVTTFLHTWTLRIVTAQIGRTSRKIIHQNPGIQVCYNNLYLVPDKLQVYIDDVKDTGQDNHDDQGHGDHEGLVPGAPL